MRRITFTEIIEAPVEKVWDILWTDQQYREWTAIFSEGSYAISDWEEGSSIQFLGGEGEGMYSRIERKIPYTFMSFEHLGVVKDGQIQPETEETRSWKGAREMYTLKDLGGRTELLVEMDVLHEHESYFLETWPKALAKVHEMAVRR